MLKDPKERIEEIRTALRRNEISNVKELQDIIKDGYGVVPPLGTGSLCECVYLKERIEGCDEYGDQLEYLLITDLLLDNLPEADLLIREIEGGQQNDYKDHKTHCTLQFKLTIKRRARRFSNTPNSEIVIRYPKKYHRENDVTEDDFIEFFTEKFMRDQDFSWKTLINAKNIHIPRAGDLWNAIEFDKSSSTFTLITKDYQLLKLFGDGRRNHIELYGYYKGKGGIVCLTMKLEEVSPRHVPLCWRTCVKHKNGNVWVSDWSSHALQYDCKYTLGIPYQLSPFSKIVFRRKDYLSKYKKLIEDLQYIYIEGALIKETEGPNSPPYLIKFFIHGCLPED